MLPVVLPVAGLEISARGEDGDIGHRTDSQDLLCKLIETLGIAGEDAHTPHTGQMLREQGSALDEAVGC